MKIGELAKATGLTAKTIRFYEGEGLVPNPVRTYSGYRVHRREDVGRLEFIRKAKRRALSLEEIRGILQLHDRRAPTCLHVRFLPEEKLAQVDAVLRDLQEFQAKLANLERNPLCSLLVSRPDWWGYVVLEGRAEILSFEGTDAEELRLALRDVYRAAGGGEHPDWDEYDQAMREQRRSIVIVVPERVYGTGV